MSNIPFGCPVIGESETNAVSDILSTPILTHGPRVIEFEEQFAEFTGARESVALSSCTAGLHLSYLALGIGRADEVIVPAQTHVATAHAVEYVGATPIFVDSELPSGNISIEGIEAAITPATKAISVVHYLGESVNMSAVMEIAQKHNLRVVEDCALSLGATFDGLHTGLHGDVGCFSFYPVKHITTGEGGMAITTSTELAEQLRLLRAFGIDRNVVHKRELPGAYDVQCLGYNYRMNEISAAIGIEQLKRLPGFLSVRRDNFVRLSLHLAEIPNVTCLQADADIASHACYCVVALLPRAVQHRRHEIVEFLKSRGVGTSVYYPHPVPLLQHYAAQRESTPKDFPVASLISYGGLALPVGPHVSAGDVDRIAEELESALKEFGENE